MLSKCLKCRKNTESKEPEVLKTKSEKLVLLPKYAVCNSKKLRFIEKQEGSELLSQ